MAGGHDDGLEHADDRFAGLLYEPEPPTGSPGGHREQQA
jgi:hypothetical protein